MSSNNVLRPLGYGEILSSSRHALGIYRRLANTCRYIISSEPDQSLKELFEAALAGVVLQQVSLRVGIADESTNNPAFVRIDMIDLRNHLQWTKARHDMDLLSILEDEQVRLFPDVTNQPPWKVLVVEKPEPNVLDVIFLVHHALCDGKSAAQFHKHLLRELRQQFKTMQELQNHILWLPKDVTLVPALEQMVKFEISWGFLFKTLWEELGPKWLKTISITPWTGGRVAIEPHQLHVRKIEVEQSNVNTLLAACRTESSTLTGLLHALLLLSLVQRLPAAEARYFRGTTPISLAETAKPPQGTDLTEDFCLCVTGVNHDFVPYEIERIRKVTTQSPGLHNSLPLIWEVSRKIRKELKARVDTLPKDDIMALLSWISDWTTFWTQKIGQPRALTWEVSNIGSPDFGNIPKSAWNIDRCIFSQPVMTCGAALSINVASVKNGLLTLSITWQETIIANDLADGIVRDLKTWLEQIAGLV